MWRSIIDIRNALMLTIKAYIDYLGRNENVLQADSLSISLYKQKV